MPILLELQRRGHEVVVRTLAGEVDLVSSLGVAAEPISPAVEAIELEDWRARSQADRGRRALVTFAARAAPETVDLGKAIERHRPDVLLLDVNCWGAATVAEASGLPWAMLSPYLLMARSREAPPFGLGLAPMSGPLGRARDTLLGRLGEVVVNRTALPPVNRLRDRHGLPRLRSFDELAARPQQMLVTTAEGFEYPRSDWARNVRFVGPLDWSPPQAPPDWLEGLADPLVLVTCSTERQSDRDLLATALEALPPVGMSVLGTSAAHDPDGFDVPAGSRVVRFLSHGAALDRAACVVCHGGMGITQKALAAGVPVVVVPFGRDQLETARRVEFAGAGVRLPAGRLAPERLACAVREAIGKRAQAERVARIFAAAGGAERAADLLEALAGSRRTVGTA
jgi:MGT family glycosyltransferase